MTGSEGEAMKTTAVGLGALPILYADPVAFGTVASSTASGTKRAGR